MIKEHYMCRQGPIAILFFITLLALGSSENSLLAQDKTRLAPENQQKYDELIRSAREHQSAGALAMQISAGLCGLLLLYGAYSVYRHGLKINSAKTIDGAPARVLSVVLIVAAIGVAVIGIVYGPSLLP